MTQIITGGLLKDMVINAAAEVERNKQQINDLNVFPVPDGDTGTNMGLTIGAGAEELRKRDPATVGKAAEITAGALLRGARGNSGVILSLLFRGISKQLKEKETADTMDFAVAMREGVTAAYKAVMKPTEGTILTVSRLASDAAVKCAETEHDFEAFFEQVIAVGEEALANTVNQNPVLQKAGVIDAGGKGYLCILQGMLMALRGEMIDTSAFSAEAAQEKASFDSFDTEDITFTYCTEFIVEKENANPVSALRDFLNNVGDSIVVVDDDEIIKVHVHTNKPGDVLSYALTYGSFVTVKIENMRRQHTEILESAAPAPAQAEAQAEEKNEVAPAEKEIGVVAVCAGEGMEEVFRDLGVDGIITGGQTMNPSTEDILKEVNATPAETVFVFPNNKNIIMAAEQCDGLTEKEVVVIPSKTVPQGISALLAMDGDAEKEELRETFCDTIKNVHTVQITYAARDSEFDGLEIKSGEYLALLENKLLANSSDLVELFNRVAEALREFSPEFISVFYGEDVDEAAAQATAQKFGNAFPDAEISLINGGQPVYYYMISAE